MNEVCLNTYASEVAAIPLLTREEENQLARAIREGDEAARERMIRANLRLVIHIAKDFLHKGLPLEDLIAEGNLGLIKAVERFDPERGLRFGKYGALWIRQSIKRALSNQARTIRLPVHVASKLFRIERARLTIQGDLRREPTLRELAKATGIDEREIEAIERSGQVILSLDRGLDRCNERPESVSEAVADERSPNPLDALLARERVARLDHAFEGLDDVEQKVIRDRFGLNETGCRSLSDIGSEFGVRIEPLPGSRAVNRTCGKPVVAT